MDLHQKLEGQKPGGMTRVQFLVPQRTAAVPSPADVVTVTAEWSRSR